MPKKVLHDQINNFLGLTRIITPTSAVIDTVGDVYKLNPELWMLLLRCWEGHQGMVGIESMIRKGDERLVAAPIVPTEPALRQYTL